MSRSPMFMLLTPLYVLQSGRFAAFSKTIRRKMCVLIQTVSMVFSIADLKFRVSLFQSLCGNIFLGHQSLFLTPRNFLRTLLHIRSRESKALRRPSTQSRQQRECKACRFNVSCSHGIRYSMDYYLRGLSHKVWCDFGWLLGICVHICC